MVNPSSFLLQQHENVMYPSKPLSCESALSIEIVLSTCPALLRIQMKGIRIKINC